MSDIMRPIPFAQLMDWALAEEDHFRARALAAAAAAAGEVLNLTDYAVLAAPFQIAVMERDGPRALELLERILRSLTVPWDLSESPLYRHLPTKDAVGESQRPLISLILDDVERDPACAFLRDLPAYPAMAEKYQRYRDA